MTKINRCPFCGGNAVTEHVTFKNPTENRCAIVCEGCGAYGPPLIGSNKQSVERYAIRLWNHRDVTVSALYGF